MQSIIRFFENVWFAQRNADAVRAFEERANKMTYESNKLVLENAALRSQINQRGAGGKFTKKSPTE